MIFYEEKVRMKRVEEKGDDGANAPLTTTLLPTLNNTIITLQKLILQIITQPMR